MLIFANFGAIRNNLRTDLSRPKRRNICTRVKTLPH